MLIYSVIFYFYLGGTPADVFQAVTYAPSSVKLVKEGVASQDKLWEEIHSHTQLNQPICCGAKKKSVLEEMGIKNKGINPGHAYTLVKL